VALFQLFVGLFQHFVGLFQATCCLSSCHVYVYVWAMFSTPLLDINSKCCSLLFLVSSIHDMPCWSPLCHCLRLQHSFWSLYTLQIYSAFWNSLFTYKRCWKWCPWASIQDRTCLILLTNRFFVWEGVHFFSDHFIRKPDIFLLRQLAQWFWRTLRHRSEMSINLLSLNLDGLPLRLLTLSLFHEISQ
jgi:hypothetical protein